jgi:hypothetical protein
MVEVGFEAMTRFSLCLFSGFIVHQKPKVTVIDACAFLDQGFFPKGRHILLD